MRALLIFLLLSMLIVGLVWYEYKVWGNCLNTNPFWYCLRILSK